MKIHHQMSQSDQWCPDRLLLLYRTQDPKVESVKSENEEYFSCEK
jgi:hypothetical protein